MRSAIHVSALLILLGGCLGLVTAQHHAATVDETVGLGTQPMPRSSTTMIARSRPPAASASAAVPRLSLSDEQRGLIFLGVINLPDIPELAMRAPEPGVPLPQTVELQDIPAMVVRRIPEVQRLQVRQARRPHPAGQRGDASGRGDDPALQAGLPLTQIQLTHRADAPARPSVAALMQR